MYTKSIIQQKSEIINSKNNFYKGLNNLTEKYNIEDSIFIYNGSSIQEVCEGYFEILKDFESLNAVINECDITNQGIRVFYNQESKSTSFQIGKIHRFLNECDGSHKILDVDRLKYINE